MVPDPYIARKFDLSIARPSGMASNSTSALDASCAEVHDGGLCPIVGSDIGWLTPVDLGDGTTETVCPGRCGAWILQDNVTGKIIDRER